MKFALLLLTDCPPTGYGLSAGQSFGEQLGRRLEQQGYDLVCTTYPIPPVADLCSWLRQLPLAEYDLIVIQPLPAWLIGVDSGLAGRWARLTGRPTKTSQLARQTLLPLRAHRHRTLFLTPFPHQHQGWHRLVRRAANRLIELGEQTGLTVFDTGRLIGRGDEYFLPDDPARLNAVSHELVGSWLYDFYRQQPVIALPGEVSRGTRPDK